MESRPSTLNNSCKSIKAKNAPQNQQAWSSTPTPGNSSASSTSPKHCSEWSSAVGYSSSQALRFDLFLEALVGFRFITITRITFYFNRTLNRSQRPADCMSWERRLGLGTQTMLMISIRRRICMNCRSISKLILSLMKIFRGSRASIRAMVQSSGETENPPQSSRKSRKEKKLQSNEEKRSNSLYKWCQSRTIPPEIWKATNHPIIIMDIMKMPILSTAPRRILVTPPATLRSQGWLTRQQIMMNMCSLAFQYLKKYNV